MTSIASPLVILVACAASIPLAASEPALAIEPLRAACTAAPGETPSLPGIVVSDEPGAVDGTRALRITNAASGDYMLAFYTNETEAIARARAACLGAQISMVSEEVRDERTGGQYWSAAFTTDPNYRAPFVPGQMPRWAIHVGPDGKLAKGAQATLAYLMPHEQVHAFQNRYDVRLPRWLAEGQAQWIQRRIVDRFDPATAAVQWAQAAKGVAQSEGPLKLSDWGNRRPKREAYYRQVSPDERVKMDADPAYRPSGTFTFTADDFEKEAVANEDARYAAAEAIVAGLAERHGRNAVNAWIADLTEGEPKLLSDEEVDASLREHFGERLANLLGEAS